MAFWDRFFGASGSTAAGIALGATAVPALLPAVQFLENEAWATHPDKPPDAVLLAQGVAQGQVDPGSAQTWANQQGISNDAFAALVNIANTGPGIGSLYESWRRGLLSTGEFNTGLKRLAIEEQWWGALRGLHDVLLSPSELANARQQGFMTPAETTAEAGLQGITSDRAEVQFELAGLPPGVEVMQRAATRGLTDQATFNQAIREGHTKTKYTDLLWQLRHQILSAATAVRAHLKGHITAAEMHARGAEWGYSPADMDLWYQSEGRPATTHQIHIGYARGASVPGAANEQDAILQAVAQSDIRPEYGPLLYESRYSLPSPFVMRSLTQTGVWSQAKAAQRLREAGWIPQDADEAAAAWSGGTTGTASDTHVSKAQTQLWTATHSSYVKDRIDDAQATTALNAAGVDPASIPQVLQTWQAERDIIRGGLSAANIKKAAKEGVFTPDEAVARLVELGWSVADANTYLAL